MPALTTQLPKTDLPLHALIENTADIIVLVDEGGEILYVNQALERITGLLVEEKLSTLFTDLLIEEEIPGMQIIFKNILQKPDETAAFTTRLVHQNGNFTWVEGRITNLLADVEAQGLIISLHDITERRTAEETLKRYYEELKRSNKELEQFAYIASHDLQEPLRMVSSFLQLIETKYASSLDDTGKKYIGFAVDGAQRMKLLINDLLEYSRVGSGKQVLTNVDLADILKNLQLTFQKTLEETGGQILADPLPTVTAVKSQMLQLFQNLVSNAIKYRSQERAPIIRIRCNEAERHYLFTVEDNGIGIDHADIDKLFVLFQRLHDIEHTGTGIGLAICKKIVEYHRGIIWAESEKGKGTKFIFMLKK
jgi:PAS domain S-box-containing protein